MGDSNVKVIICTGISCAKEFTIAFSGTVDTCKELNTKKLGKKRLIWAKINWEKTLIFVVPFPRLGQYCLNSDKDLTEFGTEIKEIADSHFSSPWHKDYQLD